MSDDEPTFETADAGAADTFPQAAGELRKGSHVMLKGHPCKVAEVTSSKTGKHGHAKCHIIGIDIFTSKKYEDLCPASHNMAVPFVKRNEYQCLTADLSSGEVSLLTPEGETRDDLNLPMFVKIGEPTDDDVKLSELIAKEVESGEKEVLITVLSACGTDKIIECKTK